MLPLKKTKEPVFWFVFTSKMSFFGNSKELQFKTSKLWQTIGKSGEQRRGENRGEKGGDWGGCGGSSLAAALGQLVFARSGGWRL